jgi:hypothetical protein
VFPQKISNSERVLLTLLYQRNLCTLCTLCTLDTLDVLADALGDVCNSGIGNLIRETRPLLQQEGHTPIPTSTRYRTTADLLAAAPPDTDASPG